MIVNTQLLMNEIIQKDISKNTNPINMQDILNELKEEKKENNLQKLVKEFSKDPEYYKHFNEAVLPNQAQQQITPQQKADAQQQEAKQNQVNVQAKTLQTQLSNVEKQQTDQNITPEKKKSLDEKKVEIQAALEKLRIDSEERIANKRIASDEKHGLKRTIAGAVSSGVGMSILPTAIGALGVLGSKVFGR
jgi:hypothetical protein